MNNALIRLRSYQVQNDEGHAVFPADGCANFPSRTAAEAWLNENRCHGWRVVETVTSNATVDSWQARGFEVIR